VFNGATATFEFVAMYVVGVWNFTVVVVTVGVVRDPIIAGVTEIVSAVLL